IDGQLRVADGTIALRRDVEVAVVRNRELVEDSRTECMGLRQGEIVVVVLFDVRDRCRRWMPAPILLDVLAPRYVQREAQAVFHAEIVVDPAEPGHRGLADRIEEIEATDLADGGGRVALLV